MLLKPFHFIRLLALFVFIFGGLVGSLYVLNASQSAFYFTNRVVADKSPNPKYALQIGNSAFTLFQPIDKSRVNVSDDRFLSDPVCLSLMLQASSIELNPPAQFNISVVDGTTTLASWSVHSTALSRDSLQLCSAGQMVLNDLASANQPQIVVHADASDQANRGVVHLSELTHGLPVIVNNSPVPDRMLPFKVNVVGSPTMLDIAKYLFLAIVASLILLVAVLATLKDLRKLNTPFIQ